MSNEKAPSRLNFLAFFIIGLVLMVGGVHVYKNNLIPLDALAESGIDLNIGKTMFSIGVLLILFKVVHFFFVTPLQEAINARTNELERTFSEAENLRAEMNAMKQDYDRRLTQQEAEAREQIQAQVREAQAVRQQMMAEASAKAEEYKQKAVQEIEQAKQQALAELRTHVVDLTLRATEKLVRESVDTERNRRLVEEFLDTVEVPR